ncbi:MAG: DUF3810 domain-containing protein [Saccharofermentanales bacterium]
MVDSNEQKSEKPQISTKFYDIITGLAFLLPGLFGFAMQRILAAFPGFVENVYSAAVFRWISMPIAYITAILPFSLTEISLFLAAPGLVLLILAIIRGFQQSASRIKTLFRYLKRIGWTISILYLVFMLLLGFNYARQPLSESMGIEVKQRSSEELEEVCYILLDRVNTLRESRSEKNGVMMLRSGISAALKQGYLGYDAVEDIYPVLTGPSVRAKGVMISHLWSYTGITGMYFPFYVEANVNIDVPEYSIPNTIMHELAHLRGLAREDEAEFAAFITGINHPDRDFKYSSYLNAFIYASNSLYGADKEAYDGLRLQISEMVLNDLRAGGLYWKQFEGPVQEASTSVNNAYLQSNMQDDGVKSYGRVVDLRLGYYLAAGR